MIKDPTTSPSTPTRTTIGKNIDPLLAKNPEKGITISDGSGIPADPIAISKNTPM